MRSIDSPRRGYHPGKFPLEVTFDLSTCASQCPRANCFSNFHPLRNRHNPLGLCRRYLGQGHFRLCHDQFYEFHLCHAQFRTVHRTKRQPSFPELRERLRGKHKQSELDDHQFWQQSGHDFSSHSHWRRLCHRRNGTAPEPKSRQ